MTVGPFSLATHDWSRVETELATALSRFADLPFGLAAPPARTPCGFAARIDLHPVDQPGAPTLWLSLLVDEDPMRSLAHRILGEGSIEDARELLLETGNILMGVLKSALAPSGSNFAIGFPHPHAHADCAAAFAVARTRTRIHLSAPDAGITLDLFLHGA